jgi:hypothetical protein
MLPDINVSELGGRTISPPVVSDPFCLYVYTHFPFFPPPSPGFSFHLLVLFPPPPPKFIIFFFFFLGCDGPYLQLLR